MIDNPVAIYTFIGSVTVLLIVVYALFRRARREACTWPRWARIAAQTPGWFLVVFGFYLTIAGAIAGIPLAVGTVAAMLNAGFRALQRPDA